MIGNAIMFGYSNARIKSLYSQLIDRGTYERMINAETMDQAVGVLADTAYRPELTELSLSLRGPALVEQAVARHISKVFRKVLRMTPGGSRVILEALMSRWDVQDIKTALLAKHLGRGQQETRNLILGAGSYTPEELEGLIFAESVQAAVKYLGESVYGNILFGAAAAYVRDGDINPILAELDKLYLFRMQEAVYESDDRLVRSLIMADIDRINVMTILRCRADGSYDTKKIMGWVVPAGNIGPHELEALAEARDWEPVVSKIGNYDLSSAVSSYRADHSLIHFEDILESHVIRHAYKTFRNSVLSLGVVVGFVYLKENEGKTIRRIVHGKEYASAPEEIRREAFR